MRKAVMMMALMALLTLTVARVSYADRIAGNNRDNTHFETSGDDRMLGKDGADVLDANNFGNATNPDDDIAKGGGNNDRVLVNDGDSNDTANGGAGSSDTCVVTDRSEVGSGCEKVRVNPLDGVADGT